VFLRVLAVLAAIVVPLVLTIDALSQLHAAMFWIGPLTAILCTLPIVYVAVGARAQAMLGAALAAMAAASTPELPGLLRITASEDSLAFHDLREGPLPESATGLVAVRGHLRKEYVVDEYHPGEGKRPDQNMAPTAVLLPFLGTTAMDMPAETLGRVIVARVSPEQLEGPQLVTLRGRLAPVGEEIVDSLFIVQVDDATRLHGPRGLSGAAGVQVRPKAVMLDTFDMPTRGEALTRTGLAVGAGLLALLLLWFAIPRRQEARPA
jgi:hypothetical protein